MAARWRACWWTFMPGGCGVGCGWATTCALLCVACSCREGGDVIAPAVGCGCLSLHRRLTAPHRATPCRMRLKFTPIEDATLGFWLMPMELRHIDHRRFFTWAAPCCFKPPKR